MLKKGTQMEKVNKRGIKCPNCGSLRTWKHGYRPTLSRGKVFRLQCSECAITFDKPENESEV